MNESRAARYQRLRRRALAVNALTGAAVLGKNLYVAAGSLKPGSGDVTSQMIVFTMP